MNDEFRNKIEDDFINLKLLSNLYSLSKEEYEKAIEKQFTWQLPYEAIKEYLMPIVLIHDETLSLQALLMFWDYYCRKNFSYPIENRITPLRLTIIKTVLKEEIERKKFNSSMTALYLKKFIGESQNEQTEFVIEKAREFLQEIEEGKIEGLVLAKDLSEEERLKRRIYEGLSPIRAIKD